MNVGHRYKHSLKARITLLTLVIFWVGIWSLAFYADRVLRQDLQDMLGRQQHSTVSMLAKEVNEDLQERLQAIEQVAAALGEQMVAQPDAMQKTLLHMPVFQNLFNGGSFVTDMDGNAIASVPESLGRVERNYLDRPEVASALREGRTQIGPPAMGRLLLAPVVRIATPIRDAKGQVRGALVGVVNLGQPNFLDKFQKFNYGKTGNYLLVDAGNRFIVTSSDKRRALEALPKPGVSPTLDRFIAGHEGYEVFVNPVGVEVLAAVAHIPVAGWYAAIALPTAEALAPVQQLQRRILLATLVLTLLSALLTHWMLGRLLEPLRATACALLALSDRQQALHALPVQGSDEISQVIRGFNRLLDDLAQRQEGLRETEERYRVAFETSPDAVSISSLADGRYVDVNEGFVRLFGWQRDEVLGRSSLELAIWSEAQERQTLVQQVLAHGHCESHEMVFRAKDGRKLVVLVSAKAITLSGERCMLAVCHDVTERKQAEQQLQLAANVFTFSREGIVITDASGNIVEVNDTFSLITGYAKAEVLGKTPKILQSGRQGPDFYAAMWQDLIRNGHWVGEIWNRRKNGDIYAEILTISAVRDGNGRVQNYVALFTDITAIKEHESQLERIAHYDPLTGLPNRLLCVEQMREAMAHCQQAQRALAVVYLDLDNFRAINDSYGHDAGETMLLELAQGMKHVLRDGDMLARIGGDEFVAVITDLAQPHDAYPVFDRLLRAASHPVAVRSAAQATQLSLQVSASMGITFYPQDDGDADQLLRHADQAMYTAKQAGKNRYHLFDVVQDAAVQSRQEGVEQIREALVNGEFVLYYQPKVNMASGQVTGAEALIRWQHPQQGLLPPAAFLPLIEGHPVNIDIGEWVIATALTQISAWSAQGMYLPISVNISAQQLQLPDFVVRLKALLHAYPGVPRNSLDLELLESSAMEDIDQVARVIRDCQALGVGFALDDFGTGYSSLTYLKRLPVETLKIDQSFVRDMLDDPTDLAIVKSVIGLAKAFGRWVIAEGVESTAHGQLLMRIGCAQAQGYCIAKPMPADAFPDWIASWNAGTVWQAWRDQPAS